MWTLVRSVSYQFRYTWVKRRDIVNFGTSRGHKVNKSMCCFTAVKRHKRLTTYVKVCLSLKCCYIYIAVKRHGYAVCHIYIYNIYIMFLNISLVTWTQRVWHQVYKMHNDNNNNQWLVCVSEWVFNSLVAVMFGFCFGCLQNIVHPVYNCAKSVLQHLGW